MRAMPAEWACTNTDPGDAKIPEPIMVPTMKAHPDTSESDLFMEPWPVSVVPSVLYALGISLLIVVFAVMAAIAQ